MAASMKFTVLCPNRRREIIKVSVNTTLLFVLEEACKKQRFNPEEYELKHCNKVLDLSLSIRFANIPNNACLEMHPTVRGLRPKATPVTIALQLEDGRRLVHDFNCTATLGEILDYWKGNSEEKDIEGQCGGEPICIYMRKEVTGEKALAETNLKSLGLIGGKAVIRLIYRPKEVLGKQAYVENLLPTKQETNEWGASDTKWDQQTTDKATWDNSAQSASAPDYDWGNVSTTETPDSKLAGQTSTMQDRLLWDGPESSSVASQSSKAERLNYNHSREENKPFENGNANNASEPSYEFASEPDVEMEDDTEEGKITYLGQRDAVLFHLSSAQKVVQADLPDDFYDLTIDDAKYLLDDIRRQREEFDNQPLLLASQREDRKRERMLQYQQTVLRINFPDRLVLQAKFTPSESVSAVKSFITKFLQYPNESFHLYTTPPKVILDPDISLINADLVPAANVYFGADVIRDVYFKQDILQQISTAGAASQVAAKLRNIDKINGKPTKRSSDQDMECRASPPDQPSTSSTEGSSVTEARRDVPKWFKLGSSK